MEWDTNFFPPIVVAITQPEENKQGIKECYPILRTRILTEENQFEIEFSEAFSVRWFLDGDTILSLPTIIRWKPDKTHLMAVDGQHRLVALQAVRDLLINDELKLFYKNVTQYKNKLDQIKVPVSVLFFPNCAENILEKDLIILKKYFPNINWNNNSHAKNVKRVLRNIFVDVNKTARQPSKSRTILLDEKDLTAVFSRIIFSKIKDENPKIYSALLEYNAISGKETQIEKGRATITTVGIINQICEFLFKDFPDEGVNLRTRLDIANIDGFPSSEEFPKENIKATEFDLSQRKVAEKIFKDKWLHVFMKLLIDFKPFKKLTEVMISEYEDTKKIIENGEIGSDEFKIFEILFGGNEKRFVLENNSKIKHNTASNLLYKKLRDKEKKLRDSVAEYDLFYTLMFQKGFFEGISTLIANNLFENDNFITSNETSYIITTLNQFITDTANNSIFKYNHPITNLILGGKASPENSQYIGSLINLILLNYKFDSNNVLLKNINVKDESRNEISEQCLTTISNRIKKSLEKEFDSQTENKFKSAEIEHAREQKDVNLDKLVSEYSNRKIKFTSNNLIKQLKQLKEIIKVNLN
eukprot:GDKJ01000965.1.p1 GENE.GDKJ01000965.1~~GDKJ01000965.1.p1  ORF type:complete len:586 (+),score=49.04 GDKJ01000965.1:195-1952(+)